MHRKSYQCLGNTGLGLLQCLHRTKHMVMSKNLVLFRQVQINKNVVYVPYSFDLR